MNKNQQLGCLLMDVEACMRSGQLWSSERPADQALASDKPFAIDTLKFEEWLQFIFIERLRALIHSEQPLPNKSSIVPMAEESFRHYQNYPRQLVALLAKVDDLLES